MPCWSRSRKTRCPREGIETSRSRRCSAASSSLRRPQSTTAVRPEDKRCWERTTMPSRPAMPIPRLLIIEDDSEREARLIGWLIPGLRAVPVRGARRALGLLRRDGGNQLAGILLDHDLDRIEPDSRINGHDVA